MTQEEKEVIRMIKTGLEVRVEGKEIRQIMLNRKNAKTLLTLLEKKDKIIDKMARMINSHSINEDTCKQFGKDTSCKDYINQELCINCIKQYFERQVKENG